MMQNSPLLPVLQRRFRAFTLIELLVVIAIIGLLSTIVLSSLNAARIKSRDARRIADMKQLQLALAVYADANSLGYPVTLQPLAPLYISVLPTDPTGAVTCTTGMEAGCYVYAALKPGGGVCSPGATSYHLGGILEDPSNQYLSTDGDFYSASSPDPGGQNCTGSKGDFYGYSVACNTSAGSDKCYDVEP